MVEWHHRIDEHEFEQALSVGDRLASRACCSPWGHKESDTTERLNNCAKHLTFIFPRQTSDVGLYFTEDKEG